MYEVTAIPVKFPEKRIFLRLGGNLTKTGLTVPEREFFRKTALGAFESGHFAGRWELFAVKVVTEEAVVLADDRQIRSADFASRCAGITHLWCGAVTAGKAIVEERDKQEKVSVRAIYDAVGAECADAAMESLQQIARNQLRNKGLILAPRRFSPGYGDMPLALQEFFFSALRLAEMGLSLSDRFYIFPEKSVTAFAGVWQGENYDTP